MSATSVRKPCGYFQRIVSGSVAFVFCLTSVLAPTPGWAKDERAAVFALPPRGTILSMSKKFAPAIVRGLTIYPDNPLQFDFIIDTGDKNLQGEDFERASQQLIKYFLAALTVPEKELWVNLSPYEGHRIIPEGLGVTEMGRDMLAQDYLLKQLTASLLYPEKELGQTFWQKVYRKAYELYGTSNIPVNTFNKVWIVPDKAVVYEHEGSAFVVQRHLKVMLEKDYVSLQNNLGNEKFGMKEQPQDQAEALNDVSSKIVKEIILPAIEQEVNEGEAFANLRQMYNSMILATWYKKNLRESLLGQVYMDQNKVKGIDLEDKAVKEKIYAQYLETFKQGVYNYIREDYDEITQKKIPRKYFSGGLGVGVVTEEKLEVLRGGLQTLPKTVSSAITQPESANGEDRLVSIELVENTADDDEIKLAMDFLETSSPIEKKDQPRSKDRREFLKKIALLAGGLALTGSLPGAVAVLAGEQPVSREPVGGEIETLLKQLNPDDYEEQMKRVEKEISFKENVLHPIDKMNARLKEIYDKRVAAAKRLIELRDERAIPGFIESYRTGRQKMFRGGGYFEELLVYSAKGLAMFGDKSAAPVLIDGMRQRMGEESLQATLEALILLEAEKEAVPVFFENLIQLYPPFPQQISKDFFANLNRSRNPEIIPLLIREIVSSVSYYRFEVALLWISQMDEDAENAAPVIADLLNEYSYRVSDRPAALLQALRTLGPYAYKAVPILIKKFKRYINSNINYFWIIKEVATTLGVIGDKRAVPVLVEALYHENKDVSNSALSALNKFPQNAHPVLLRDRAGNPDFESIFFAWSQGEDSLKKVIVLFLSAPQFRDKTVEFFKKRVAVEIRPDLKDEYASLLTEVRSLPVERWIDDIEGWVDDNKIKVMIAGGALVAGGIKVTYDAWRQRTLRGNLYDLVHGSAKRDRNEIRDSIVGYGPRVIPRLVSFLVQSDSKYEKEINFVLEGFKEDFTASVLQDIVHKFELLEQQNFARLPEFLKIGLLAFVASSGRKEYIAPVRKLLNFKFSPGILYSIEEAAVKAEGIDESIFDFYIRQLENKSVENKIKAALALGDIGNKEAVLGLERQLVNLSGEEENAGLPRDYLDALEEALVKIKRSREDLVRFYLESLSARGDRAKSRAAQALGEWGVEEAGPLLLKLITSGPDEANIYYYASQTALVKLGFSERVEEIIKEKLASLREQIDKEPENFSYEETYDANAGQGPENQMWHEVLESRTVTEPNRYRVELLREENFWQARLDNLFRASEVASTTGKDTASSPINWEQRINGLQQQSEQVFSALDAKLQSILYPEGGAAPDIGSVIQGIEQLRDEPGQSIFVNLPLGEHEALVEQYERVLSLLRMVLGDDKAREMGLNEIHLTIATPETGPDAMQYPLEAILAETRADTQGKKPFKVKLLGPHLTPNGAIVMEYEILDEEFADLRAKAKERIDAREFLNHNRASVPNIYHSSVAFLSDSRIPVETLRRLFEGLTALRAVIQSEEAVEVEIHKVAVSLLDNTQRKIITSRELVLGEDTDIELFSSPISIPGTAAWHRNRLDHENPAVRKEAVEAIALKGGYEDLAAVAEKLNDDDEGVRSAAGTTMDILKAQKMGAKNLLTQTRNLVLGFVPKTRTQTLTAETAWGEHTSAEETAVVNEEELNQVIKAAGTLVNALEIDRELIEKMAAVVAELPSSVNTRYYDQMSGSDVVPGNWTSDSYGPYNDLLQLLNTARRLKKIQDQGMPISSPVEETVGGIDFNPAALDLQIKRDGNGVPLPLPQQPVGDMRIDGFLPVIINITPVNILMLLGMAQEGGSGDRIPSSSSGRTLSPADTREKILTGQEENISWLN